MTIEFDKMPDSIYRSEITRLRGIIRENEDLLSQLTGLYRSVNMMICELAANGEITSMDPKVAVVMDKLHEIDAGTFDENLGK